MRKLILKSVLCLFCLVSGIQLNAQAIYTGNTTSPTACDGSAFIDSLPVYTSFVWMEANTVIATDTNYVTGLCAGTYNVTATGSTTNGDTTITFTIGTASPCDNLIVNVTLAASADPGTCNGALVAYASGGTAPYSYSWDTGSTSSMATGLCGDTLYSIMITDANGCTTSTFSTVPTDSTQPNPCTGFGVITDVTNITGPNECDGSVTISIVGGTAPYLFSWSNGETTASLHDLCTGYYSLTVTDSLGCTASGWASFYSDTLINGDSSLVIYTYPSNVSADGVCDGQLSVSTWGGVAPYAFVLSSGASNTTGYFDSLCQGIYTVCVYDQVGDTISMDFIISNPSNNYNNPTYGDSLFIDSIMADLQANCQLNYQGIDSVFITGYDIFGDSILVYWNIVTSTGSTTVTQLYYIGGGAGVYSLGIQLYCPGKALGSYLTATDQIYFGGPLGIKENALGEVSIYPNPVSDKLNIRFAEAGAYEVVLYDLTGREIMKAKSNDADHILLDVNAIGKGQYVLKVTGSNGFMSKSIVK